MNFPANGTQNGQNICEESKGKFKDILDDKYSIIANPSIGDIQESFVQDNKSNRCHSEGICDRESELKSAEKQVSTKDP